MVTIESSSALLTPGCRTVVTIEDTGSIPSIRLGVEDVKHGPDLNFAVDGTRRLQKISFYGLDGDVVEMDGKVREVDAVDFPRHTACKVVVAVELGSGMTSAREKGDRSRTYLSLYVSKVLEVWEDAKGPRYVAQGWTAGNPPSPQKTIDLASGRIAGK